MPVVQSPENEVKHGRSSVRELKTYRDLFAKLKRDAEAFANNPSSDNLFNAVVTAWSLADWIHADAPLSVAMDLELEQLTGRNSSGATNWQGLSIEMHICKDLANGSKHAKITHYKPAVNQVGHSDGGFGHGPFGLGPFGGGEFYYIVTGNQYHNAENVITKAVDEFERFFKRHQLI